MSTDTRQQVLTILSSVPKGAVVSYGQVAELAGLGKGARQVGQILRALPEDTQIPWHRVVSASGNISLRGERALAQICLLELEGICVMDNRVNMKKYRWL
ncbi:MAG: MGMT family protein [Porticoccaceae bacterium]